MDSQTLHRHLSAPVSRAVQTAPPQAQPAPSAITAPQAPTLPVSVNVTASLARETASSSTVVDLVVATLMMMILALAAHPMGSTFLRALAGMAWLFDDDELPFLKEKE